MEQHVPSARREAIAARIATGRTVNSAALAAEFRVSEDAIRRDLRALAAEGRCRRVYGGALPPTAENVPLNERIAMARERKTALARAVAEMARPGELIFLDSGSTNFAVVEALPDDRDLTIATNSVPIAAAVLPRPHLRLLVIGGRVDPVVGGCVEANAATEVSKLNIDLCVLGACAISAHGGISSVDSSDRTFKQALLAASRRTIVLATTEKLGTDAPYRVAELGRVDMIVVEEDAPVEAVEILERAGAPIRRAKR